MPIAKTKKTIALFATTAFAFTAIGTTLDHQGDFAFVAKAYAKSENAGGNGNGGGNGGGNGNSGGNGGGNGNSGSHGNSASNNGKANSTTTASASRSNGNGSSGNGNGLGGLIRGIFGKKSVDTSQTAAIPSNNSKKSAASTKSAAVAKGKKPATSQITNLAELPVPQARPDKNFRAKLAGLNSLNRNFHAYLNTADPRMAAIRDYVLASVDYENTLEELAAAEERLQAAEDAFAQALSTALTDIDPYAVGGEDFSYDGVDLEGLAARQSDLQTALADLGDLEGADDATLAEAQAIQDELDAIGEALASTEAGDLQTASDDVDGLNDEVEELAGQITDEQLTEALLAAANDNRIAEYGEDGYVDGDMLDWAKSLLGVDTRDEDGAVVEEFDGKIDEIRDYLASQAEAADEGDTDGDPDES